MLQITDQTGAVRQARSNPFGFCRFSNIASSQSIVVSVAAKNLQFASSVVNAAGDVTDLNFTPFKPSAP